MSNSRNAGAEQPLPLARVISIGCLLSLCAGLADGTIGMAARPLGLSSPLNAVIVIGVTAGAVLAAFLLSWIVVIAPLIRWRRLNHEPPVLGLAAFWGAFLAVVAFAGTPDSVLAAVRVLALSLAFAGMAFLLGTRIDAYPAFRRWVGSLLLAAPLVLALVATAYWYRLCHAVSPVLTTTGAAFGAVVVLSLVHRVLPRLLVKGVVTLAALVFVAAPFVFNADALEHEADWTGPGNDPPAAHVFLIVVDTLRADALSCYGNRTIPTPHLDALAADGAVYLNALSPAPWTLPAMASMMTGVYPNVHLALRVPARLPMRLRTLAEGMLEAGYDTGAIGYNPFVPRKNFSQGFVHFDFQPGPSLGASLGAAVLDALETPMTTGEITHRALRWIEGRRNRPTFLWLHYFDPHMPYTPPERFLPAGEAPPRVENAFSDLGGVLDGTFVPTAEERARIRSLYEGEVRYVDESLGVLLDGLRDLGIYESSLIVLTSDHGEEFWEHGGFEHGHSLYRELLHVPLIVKFPRSRARGARSEVPVSTAGVYATILEACGIACDRQSLSAGPFGEEAPAIYSTGITNGPNREAVVFEGYKYIRHEDTGREEFYELDDDPYERAPLGDPGGRLMDRARELLGEFKRGAERLGRLHGIEGTEEGEVDENTLRRLRALGYVN